DTASQVIGEQMRTQTQRGAAGLVASAAVETRRLGHHAALAIGLRRGGLCQVSPARFTKTGGGVGRRRQGKNSRNERKGGVMTTLAFHPLANVFPLLEGEPFAALVHDIATQGLQEPLVLYQGYILDGRNRARACMEAGVTPQYSEYAGDDPLAYV